MRWSWIERMLDTKSYKSFDSAAHAVLKFLHRRLGFGLWMVTRTEGDDWIVLQAEDHGYGIKEGDVFRWADSFCSRMVEGLGPRVAPRSAAIPAYASAPIGQQVNIGAYVGVPLAHEQGSLFGTLCAIDPAPQPDAIASELPLIELLARMLSTLLDADLKVSEQARKAERSRVESLTDALTSLYNRRGWEELLTAEELRCRRYGNPACILSIDLDGLKRINDTEGHARGDELICRAAEAIRSGVRTQDVAARLGGDEFAVLGVECDAAGAQALEQRVSDTLAESGVEASIGVALRDPGKGLVFATNQADQAMYETKRARKRRMSSS
jgi:diguanylate cyclase (GGDEF)-like protein